MQEGTGQVLDAVGSKNQCFRAVDELWTSAGWDGGSWVSTMALPVGECWDAN
jgi:hypothetical protein